MAKAYLKIDLEAGKRKKQQSTSSMPWSQQVERSIGFSNNKSEKSKRTKSLALESNEASLDSKCTIGSIIA
jgi:hypothetical protein